MARILVQAADFDTGAELARLQDSAGPTGAIASFLGIVRNNAAGTLAHLTLEHYPGMTEAALARIAATAEQRFALTGCTIIHRVGPLSPGARIVLAAAAAPHRRAALDATGFLIDWLKTRAPFWKREAYTDGSAAWVEAACADDDAARAWDDPGPG